MANENNTTENDGAAQALSVLYEANDLLNAMRTVTDTGSEGMGSTEWTLSGEVAKRLNSAIACLDGSVPDDETAESKPAESKPVAFDDRHYIVLAGIIGTWRQLFREINEPDDRQALEDLSCSMDVLVDNLAAALGRRGLRGAS